MNYCKRHTYRDLASCIYDDSGDEPYSPKLAIACDTDEECMVEDGETAVGGVSYCMRGEHNRGCVLHACGRGKTAWGGVLYMHEARSR